MSTATKATHTPGPWHIGRVDKAESLEGYTSRFLVRSGLSSLAMIPQTLTPAEQEANANVIAAAPKMLEALELAAKWFATPDPNTNPQASQVIQSIDAAICKARGEE